jgi:hypothetical protein
VTPDPYERHPREPHPNTVRLVVAVVTGIIALILALNAVGSWSDAQGIGAQLLGVSDGYARLAALEALGAIGSGLIAAFSIRAYARSRREP